MRILMNLNVSKETFRNHRGILRTCFPPPFFQDHERAYFDSADWVLGKVTRGTDQPAKTAAEMNPCDHLLPMLTITFVQQGASSSNGATVPAAEPLKPKLQVGQNEIKNSKGFLNHSSSKSKALMGASVFSSLKRTAYHQLPPRRPACTSE